MIESPERRIAAHAHRIALEEALKDRLKWRRDYSDGGFIRALFSHRWDDLRAANNAEIRRLIRLLRRERAR